MVQQPDFYIDPEGNVSDAHLRKYSHASDSPPPPQRPVGSANNASSKKNQPGGGVIFIPIGLILTLILALLRSCVSGSSPDYSENVIYYYNSGMRSYAQGDYKKALVDFNEAISSVPKFAQAYNGRGLVNDAQGD